MPVLVIRTNVLKQNIKNTILSDLTRIMAETLEKDKKYICVIVHPGVWMSFGGSEEPCASIVLSSIGLTDKEKKVHYAKIVMDYIVDAMGVQEDRMYLEFQDKAREDVGYKSTTFAAL